MQQKKRTSINIGLDTHERLQRLSAATHRSISGVVETAVQLYDTNTAADRIAADLRALLPALQPRCREAVQQVLDKHTTQSRQ